VTSKRPRAELPRWFARLTTFVVGSAAILTAAFVIANHAAPAVPKAAHLHRFSYQTPPTAVSLSSSATIVAPVHVQADAKIDRSGYSIVGSGVLFVPTTFHSDDGAFDLLVFFHGNAELVAQSAVAAQLNALVLVVNLGIGSGAYESHYFIPAMFQRELDRVVEVAASRGLITPRMRRLALGAWSAGYGAILRILTYESVHSMVSAVLLADALHSNLKEEHPRVVDLERLAPFIEFAKEAAAEDNLFVMTHSEINEFHYATTTETSSALIDAVGAYRSRATDWPDRPTFPLARRVMTNEKWLEQSSEALKGHFHVRGYRGYREDDHIAHLAQISSTLFAELVTYWSPSKPKRRR
jgi:hypothetical protein